MCGYDSSIRANPAKMPLSKVSTPGSGTAVATSIGSPVWQPLGRRLNLGASITIASGLTVLYRTGLRRRCGKNGRRPRGKTAPREPWKTLRVSHFPTGPTTINCHSGSGPNSGGRSLCASAERPGLSDRAPRLGREPGSTVFCPASTSSLPLDRLTGNVVTGMVRARFRTRTRVLDTNRGRGRKGNRRWNSI